MRVRAGSLSALRCTVSAHTLRGRALPIKHTARITLIVISPAIPRAPPSSPHATAVPRAPNG
eukprot:4172806-Prymnesium_polylepis.1